MPKHPVAIVESVHLSAVREINALEQRIVTAEDDADAMLWEQARQVVAMLKPNGTMTQRELAAQWVNARESAKQGKTVYYSQSHVVWTKRTFEQFTNQNPRPRFRDAYNEIANAEPSSSTAHVSHNSGNNEWYTPEPYIEAARLVLGEIDLDPASSEEANAIVRARAFYTEAENGLDRPWRGRVWMNPPYAHPQVELFSEKLARSVRDGDVSSALVLVNNATETEWFRTLISVSAAICFPAGRVPFWSPDRESATPLQGQAVLYVGSHISEFISRFVDFGPVWIKP